MNKKRFLKIRLIYNIMKSRPVIANAIFEGGFKLLSENGAIISNNRCK